jgi:hypothetical protein
LNIEDEGFIAREQAVPASQQIAFDDALTDMFAQDLDDAAVV